MPALESKRLFIAIALPETIKHALSETLERLKKSGADVKWIDCRNIHLTLKFLGDTQEEKIPGLKSALDGEFQKTETFQTNLTQLGGFPSINYARVIWAGLDNRDNRLSDLFNRMEESLLKVGIPKETRAFHAHITLGRIRSSRNRVALIEKIHQINREFKQETLLINNVTLFESRLSPQGPTYTALHQVQFSET